MKKKAEATGVYYIGLRDPAEVRRNLLECARESIHFMQRYEKLKSVREEKLQLARSLDVTIKELKNLMGQLRKMLPATRVSVKVAPRRQVRPPIAEKNNNNGAAQVPTPVKSSGSELDKLENELAEIESRLDGM